MSDAGLARLARSAGLESEWTDAGGKARHVSPEVLRAVLEALALPAGNAFAVKDSLGRLKEEREKSPPLEIARPGEKIHASARHLCLTDEAGSRIFLNSSEGLITAPRRPGYYTMTGCDRRIAVVPPRAFYPKVKKAWGIGVQLYALRGGTTTGFGDFAALADFAQKAAELGADALAISPVHALFGARPEHISPYAPSTRLFLNPLYAQLDRPAAPVRERLVDWVRAADEKKRGLHQAFAGFAGQKDKFGFAMFVRHGGQRLLDHARFEVLDARFRALGLTDWHKWPAEFRDYQNSAVHALKERDPEMAFQLFLQWHAAQGLAAAAERAKGAGMRIGLIADMAVGMDPGGSHAWSAPEEILQGITVGAPPDLFNTKGQNWGLTNLSPHALRRTGFQGFIATVESVMRYAGGIRIDHAMGLMRLWVIPHGADAHDGVYLRYPRTALLGLLALESERHRALVIAEDLGTVPEGFRNHLAKASMLGMHVLWFERDNKGRFIPPGKWDHAGAALSTTHDLPTLAGWWSGRDIEWRARTGLEPRQAARQRKARAREKKDIWTELRRANAVQGRPPSSTRPGTFIDGAFRALAATQCPLALLPIEDFIGEKEQPNIPGTLDEHPNWRRSLKQKAPLRNRAAKCRAAILTARRL